MRATSPNRTEEQDPGLGLGEWTTVLLAFAGLLAAALFALSLAYFALQG